MISPPTSHLHASPPFVGRDAELAALAASMRGDSTDRLRLVVGPAGIGKSRLVAELAKLAEATGRRVVWAQCWDSEAGPAFWPWTQVVRELLDTPDATELATLLLDDVVEATPIALFDATARTLRSAALEHPLLVIVEDLHQADPASIALASFLATHVRDTSLFIVATTRPVDALVRALTDDAAPLALEPLDLASVGALIPANVDREAVFSASGGNPLLISTIIRSGISPEHVHAGMARVIGDRVDALDGDARRLLVALSVLGLDASFARLADVTQLDVDAATLAAATSIDAALLEPCRTDDSDGVRFSHQVIAEVVARDAEPALVASLHARAAELLGDGDAHLAQRAHHLAHAGPEHAADAVTASLRAASASLAALAHDDSVRLCAQALALLPAGDKDTRARALALLSRAQWLAGEHALAITTSDAAWEAAQSGATPEVVAESALGPRFGFAFNDPRAAERARRLELALAQLADTPTALRVRVMAALALAQLVPDPAAAVVNAERAVDIASMLDDHVALGFALVARSAADLSPDTLPSRLRDARRILDIARRTGEQLLAPSGYLLLLGALLESGDIRALDGELTDVGDVGDGFENLLNGRHAQWFRTVRATLDGDTARAEALINESFALAQRDGDADGESVWAGQLSIVRWMQDRLDETEPVLAVAVQRFPGELVWAASLAWVRLRLGRREAASGFLATLGDIHAIPRDRNWLATVAIIADIIADVGNDDEVQDAYRALEPYARQLVPIGLGVTCWGTSARPLGRLAHRMGDRTRAIEHFRTAIAVCARTGAQPWLAEAQLDLADALGLDDLEQLREAKALVREALAAADQREWPALRSTAEAALSALPDVSEPPAVTAAPPSPPSKPLIRVLGRFEVVAEDGTVASWSSRKARELLKILVAARGQSVSRDLMESELWPGVGTRALANRLSVTLATVRRALDPGREHPVQHFVRFDGEAFALESSRVDVDAEEFLALAHRAIETVDIAELDRAISAYQGDAFAEEPYAEWADSLRSSAQSAFCDVAALRADEALDEGWPGRAAELFRDILAIDEFDLSAHRGLNRALAALGAQHQSRAAQLSYDHVVRELNDDRNERAERPGTSA